MYIISGSFHKNMTYSYSVGLEKNNLNDPTPLLHFCNYLPVEEDMPIHFINLEVPLPKEGFFKV
jgi:hypothetical protein